MLLCCSKRDSLALVFRHQRKRVCPYSSSEFGSVLCVSGLREKRPHRNNTLVTAQLSSPERAAGAYGNAAFVFYSTVIDRSPAAPAPDPRLPPQSCLLLPPTPVRGGQKAVVSRKTNMHIFIESGLRVRTNPKVRLPALGGCVPFPAAESLVLLISTVNVLL